MHAMDGSDGRNAAAAVRTAFDPTADRPWTAPVEHLGWSVAQIVAHAAAQGPLWYSIDLAAGGVDLTAVQVWVQPDASPGELLATVTGTADLLAQLVTAAAPTARGYHPMGAARRVWFRRHGV